MSFIKPPEHTIVKYAAGEATHDEAEQVAYWLSLDPVTRKCLEDIRWILEESNQLNLPGSGDEEAYWLQFRQRMDTAPAKAKIIKLPTLWIRIAAMLVLALSAVTYYFLSKDRKQSNPVQLLKIVAGNQERTDSLPDGSVVTLASHSSLQFPSRFTSGLRATRLEGEAFFLITRDSSKPFTVSVHDIIITVRGTSFRVRSSAFKTEIMVKTGIVRVSRLGYQIELVAGEQISVLQKDSVLRKDSVITKATVMAAPKQANTEHIENNTARQKEIMRSIIQQLVSDHLAPARDSIVWFVLSEQGLIINGVRQSPSVYKKFKEKYLRYGANGFYYGPVKMTGKGFFYSKEELL